MKVDKEKIILENHEQIMTAEHPEAIYIEVYHRGKKINNATAIITNNKLKYTE